MRSVYHSCNIRRVFHHCVFEDAPEMGRKEDGIMALHNTLNISKHINENKIKMIT